MPLKLQIRPTWHLAKWSVAWTVVDIVKENKVSRVTQLCAVMGLYFFSSNSYITR